MDAQKLPEIAPRSRNWRVTYRVVLSSAGPFHFGYFSMHRTPEQVEMQVRAYLGSENIKELWVEPKDKHRDVIHLTLVADAFFFTRGTYGVSPNDIVDEVREFLPPEETVEVTVTEVVDMGGHGFRR